MGPPGRADEESVWEAIELDTDRVRQAAGVDALCDEFFYSDYEPVHDLWLSSAC